MASPLLSYRREGGTPPSDSEYLDVFDDGTFTLWRTIARASQPSSPVGSFAGRLDDAVHQQLVKEAGDCAQARPVELDVPRGGSTDTVEVGEVTSSWGDDANPPAPWGALAQRLRALLGELTASPRAAITLERPPSGPRLVHLGPDALELDLSNAEVRAVRWEEGVAAETWWGKVAGPRSVQAGPGWTWQLEFDHPWPGAEVSAHVDGLLAFDGRYWHACALDQVDNER